MRKGDCVWGGVLLAICAFLLIPATNRLFSEATQKAPYLMGFVKFMILATMGEFLALRILNKHWSRPAGLIWKAIVWGIIGMLVVLMFQLYTNGVAGAAKGGYLWLGGGFLATFLSAFLASTIMNLTFGPVFMAVHRISDTLIECRSREEKPTIRQIVHETDWPGFIGFVVGRTIPLFWIPAHTVAFLLPGEYRVLFAAFLSIALGAFLAYARRRKST